MVRAGMGYHTKHSPATKGVTLRLYHNIGRCRKSGGTERNNVRNRTSLQPSYDLSKHPTVIVRRISLSGNSESMSAVQRLKVPFEIIKKMDDGRAERLVLTIIGEFQIYTVINCMGDEP